MKKGMLIGCMILGFLVFTGSVEAQAQYDYDLAYGYSNRDAGYRNAVAMDDWLERGRAAVTESPLFPDGIRLTAEGGEGADEPGLASAIYYFTIPRGAQYLTIGIRYNDTAQDDTIAGRLWIKSSDTDMRGETGVGEEAPLYGDTFVLRSERSSETITVPTSRHVEGGMVEMHIVAGGSDCIDVRDIRIEYLYTRPQITVVRRTCDDYWDWWPRYRYAYHYYYWGPLFWPHTLLAYECWDVPIRVYWATWRPWFFVNIIHVHHHQPWWGPRRYTVVYHRDLKLPLIKRRTLVRTRLREHQVQVTRILHTNPVARTTDRTTPLRTHLPPGQEVRLKKEVQTPRTSETRINQDPTPRHLKEQPVRVEKQGKEIRKVDIKDKATPIRGHDTGQQVQETKERGRPSVDTQTKTVKAPPVVNKPDSRQTRPSDTAPKRIQKEQPQPRIGEQQPRSSSVARETVREPAKVGAAQDYSAKQEPTVQRRAGIGQETRPQPKRETRQARPQARHR